MVKTLHQIDSISDSLSLDDARRVNLVSRSNGKCPRPGGRDDTNAWGDLHAAVTSSLASPLNFPPLASTVVPGDRVAIAVDDGVPQAGAIMRAVVDALQEAGIEAASIAIVTTSSEVSQACREAMSLAVVDAIEFVVHDPTNRENLCMLGVTPRGALLLNRTLFDADVVLPIGCARLNDFGVFDSLYPQFCDIETIERFRLPAGMMSDEQHDAFKEETDDAGGRIGSPLVVRIVPGGGGRVGSVVAGEPRAVYDRCAELCRQWWMLEAERRASLVIATISGGSESQTWQNIARALDTAERLVDVGGAIAICSNLARPLGKSLGRLVGASDLESIERKILADRASDSWPAWELVRALQRGPVYFLSQLDSDLVEEMGLAPVADVTEITRLASRHECCIVVDDSQHVAASVSGE